MNIVSHRGSGLIGSTLVATLRKHGHEVQAPTLCEDTAVIRGEQRTHGRERLHAGGGRHPGSYELMTAVGEL